MNKHNETSDVEYYYDRYLTNIDSKRKQCSKLIHIATLHLRDEVLASELQVCRQNYLLIGQTLIHNDPTFQIVDLMANNEIFRALEKRVKWHDKIIEADENTFRFNTFPEAANDELYMQFANDTFALAHKKVSREHRIEKDELFIAMKDRINSLIAEHKPQIDFLSQADYLHQQAIRKILDKGEDFPELRADLNLRFLWAANDEIFEEETYIPLNEVVWDENTIDVQQKKKNIIPIEKAPSFMGKIKNTWNKFWKKVA